MQFSLPKSDLMVWKHRWPLLKPISRSVLKLINQVRTNHWMLVHLTGTKRSQDVQCTPLTARLSVCMTDVSSAVIRFSPEELVQGQQQPFIVSHWRGPRVQVTFARLNAFVYRIVCILCHSLSAVATIKSCLSVSSLVFQTNRSPRTRRQQPWPLPWAVTCPSSTGCCWNSTRCNRAPLHSPPQVNTDALGFITSVCSEQD